MEICEVLNLLIHLIGVVLLSNIVSREKQFSCV